MSKLVTLGLCVAALVSAFATPAFAQETVTEDSGEAQKHFMAGWEFDRAPVNSQISIYTDFSYHAADGSVGADFANLTLKVNAQFHLGGFAVFGQWGARIIDGDPSTATGRT